VNFLQYVAQTTCGSFYQADRQKIMQSLRELTEKHRVANNQHNLVGKKALVVGGNQGIGYGVAYVLAKRGASVIIAGRNKKYGDLVVSELLFASTTNAKFEFKSVDLADLEDTKRFIAEISEEKFDYIVWSAGYIAQGNRKETKDGIEQFFQVCYLSRFIGFNLLLATLKKNGRVLSIMAPYVDVFANGRFSKQFDVDDLQGTQPGKWEELELNKFNTIVPISLDLLNRALSEKHHEYVFFHAQPGYIKTNVIENSNANLSAFAEVFGDMSNWPSRTPKEYGETAVFLLTDPALAKDSGKGINWNGVVFADNSFLKDPNCKKNTDKLWDYSLKLAGL
jgi:hypothetical protein